MELQHPKYLSAYAYFRSGGASKDENLARARKEMPSYLAKRITSRSGIIAHFIAICGVYMQQTIGIQSLAAIWYYQNAAML